MVSMSQSLKAVSGSVPLFMARSQSRAVEKARFSSKSVKPDAQRAWFFTRQDGTFRIEARFAASPLAASDFAHAS